MLFWSPACLINPFRHIAPYMLSEKMCMDPVLVALGLLCVTEMYWSLSGGSDYFISYDFATGTMQGYRAEQTALVKGQKLDNGPVVPK